MLYNLVYCDIVVLRGENMGQKRKLDTRDSIRVVTANDFIVANGLQNLSIKARKLLYITISQCRQTDKEFYEYEISVPEFAKLMEISSSHVYEEAFKITEELASTKISIESKKGFRHYPVTALCEYDENSYLRIELNKKMTDFLLELKGSFSKPLLEDFLKMKSCYSMAIWHLMQKKMNSKKPFANEVIAFEISLDELRQVTGTQEKFKRLSDIKRYVLEQALKEIKTNCGIIITYENVKKARTVIGFKFVAKSQTYNDKIPDKYIQQAKNFKLKQKSQNQKH